MQDSADAPSRPAFVVDGAPTGFARRRNRVGVPTYGAPNHRGRDVIGVVGKPQTLIAKFAYGAGDKDLKGETVHLFRLQQGQWVRIGEAVTTKDGERGEHDGVADDGGRLFHLVEPPLPPGRHPLVYRVAGDLSRASAEATIVEPRTQTVIFDIDGTITIGDGEIINQVIDKLGSGDYVPRIREGAAEVARAWAEKGALIIYLTGRPDLLEGLTRTWLREQGLPPGPVRLADRLRQVRSSDNGVGRFKTGELKRWVGLGLDIVAVYGNAETDISAYAAAGIPLERTFIAGEHAGKGGTQPIVDYREHLPWVLAHPALTRRAPGSASWDRP